MKPQLCPGQKEVLKGGTLCVTLCLTSPCGDIHHTIDLRQRRHHRSALAAVKAEGNLRSGFAIWQEYTLGTTRSWKAFQPQATADAVAWRQQKQRCIPSATFTF